VTGWLALVPSVASMAAIMLVNDAHASAATVIALMVATVAFGLFGVFGVCTVIVYRPLPANRSGQATICPAKVAPGPRIDLVHLLRAAVGARRGCPPGHGPALDGKLRSAG
jgi:hypothetical protein